MTTSGKDCLSFLIKTINTDNLNYNDENLNKKLSTALEILSIDTWTNITLFGFLDVIVRSCYNTRKKILCRFFIDKIDELRINVDSFPTITRIVADSKFDKDLIQFCVDCYFDKKPIDYFVDLVNAHNDILAVTTARSLSTFFTDISAEEWNALYKSTFDDDDIYDGYDDETGITDLKYSRVQLRDFFMRKSNDTGSFGDKPDWVRTFEQVPISPIKHKIFSPIEASQIIISELETKQIEALFNKKQSVNNDMLTDIIRLQYSIDPLDKKLLSVHKNLQTPPNDFSIFREYGPVNTFYSYKPDDDDDCCKYGGCRMFLCNEYEDTDDSGIQIDIMSIDEQQFDLHWFRGCCQVCDKPISNEHYALRMPLVGGGWKGCFCSEKCLLDSSFDKHTKFLIQNMMDQLQTIGIRERH